MKIVQLILFCWVLNLPAFAANVQILAKPAPGANETAVQNAFGGQGATQITNISQINVRVLSLPDTASTNAIIALGNNPLFEFAERDEAITNSFIPNDPSYGSQWHLAKMQCPAAWDFTRGLSTVIIAILDTGIESTHPDLAANLVPGWNFYDNNNNTSDVTGHGTGVAGVAAAVGNNSISVASVAMNCKIMPLRISDTTGFATFSAMATAITYAADHGARVASLSYKASDSSTVKSAAQYLQSKGGVTTISAGNDGTFNANLTNASILTISATDSSDVLASFSATGNNIDLAAPGQGVVTTWAGGGIAGGSGTSFAAPCVAGVAALIISVNPNLTSAQIQSILKNSADDLGTAGWDSSYGWGRVNAFKALQLAGGYTGTISVTATPGCNWAVSVDVPWISIVNGASGTGNGTVTYLVANNPTSVTRTGRITAAGKLLIVTQTGIACTYTIAPSSVTLTDVAGNGVITITASDPICAWTAVSNNSWIIVSPSSGTGSSSVNYTVAATSLGTTRIGTVTVAGQTFTVTQTGDTTVPVVALTSPANGSTISNIVNVTATATDLNMARVDFYRDGTVLIGTDTTTPYSLPFQTTNIVNGSHTFYARGFDVAGNQGFSGTNTVTISNTAPSSTNVWAQSFGGQFSDAGLAVAVDGADNIYAAGNFAGTVSFGGAGLTNGGNFDFFLAKYSSAGVHQWSVRYGETGAEQNVVALTVDPSGNLLVCGIFTGTINLGGTNLVSAGGNDIFLAKYSSLGVHTWSERFGGTLDDLVFGMAAASNNDVLICGSFVGSVNFGGSTFNSQDVGVDSYMARYTALGAHVWSQTFTNTNGGTDRATGIALDSIGNVLLTGFFGPKIDLGGGALFSTNSSIDVYVGKFTSGGVYTWGKVRGGINTDRSSCIAVDPSGNVIIGGLFQTATDLGGGIMTGPPSANPDQFIVKYSGTDGSFSWAKIFGCSSSDGVSAVKTDSSGNIGLTGFYNISSLIVGSITLGNAGSHDVFVIKYATDGTLLWAKSAGGAGADDAYGIALDSIGAPVVIGAFNGTANFGGQILTSSGFSDMFLMRMAP